MCKRYQADFEILRNPLTILNAYSISPRYPDELDELTIEDAIQSYNLALEIQELYEITSLDKYGFMLF